MPASPARAGLSGATAMPSDPSAVAAPSSSASVVAPFGASLTVFFLPAAAAGASARAATSASSTMRMGLGTARTSCNGDVFRPGYGRAPRRDACERAVLGGGVRHDPGGHGDEVHERGGDHERVEELVEAEGPRPRVGAPGRVDRRPEGVQDAADEEEHEGRDAHLA